jgi:hypothetical protein
MKVVPLEGSTMTVPELVELAKDGAVILTRDGQPLISVRDVSSSDWESAALAQNPRFAALIERSRRSYRDKGGIGIEQLRRELGLEQASDKEVEAPTARDMFERPGADDLSASAPDIGP